MGILMAIMCSNKKKQTFLHKLMGDSIIKENHLLSKEYKEGSSPEFNLKMHLEICILGNCLKDTISSPK